MRLLVTGGRDFSDQRLFDTRMAQVDELYRISCVIEGYARGTDTMARLWAVANGRELCTMPADWATYGPRAGPIRNGQMLRVGKPELVLAFPGGPGTADMMRRARAAGLTVWEARW